MKNNASVQLQLLNTKNLTSGAEYQRPIEPSKIQNIVSNFDEHKVNAIKVSFRDDKYWVFDGQHTLASLKAINKGDDCVVRCEVHYGLTYEDEARLFAKQNDGSTNVDIAYKMKALKESGDQEILNIVDIVNSVGLEINFDKCKGINKIIAVKKIRDIYRSLGEEGLRKVLYLIKETWSGDIVSLDKDILGGVTLFYKTYKDIFDESLFIKQLYKTLPIEIKRRGKSDASCTGDLRFAKQILEVYNISLRQKNRLDYKYKG